MVHVQLILTFAAAKAGASLVVIDPARSADSIVDILGEERVRGLVFSARYAGANRLGDVESLFPELENCASHTLLAAVRN